MNFLHQGTAGVASGFTWVIQCRVHLWGRRGDSIMAKNIERKKAKKEETLSDQEEIWLTIRYLDPDVKRKACDSGVIVTLLVLFSIVCVVVALLYGRGL